MSKRVILQVQVEIDDEQPIGPQIVEARKKRVLWKVLEAQCGIRRQQLDRFRRRALEGRPTPTCRFA